MKMLPLKKLFRETFSQLDDSKTNIKEEKRDEKHFNFFSAELQNWFVTERKEPQLLMAFVELTSRYMWMDVDER